MGTARKYNCARSEIDLAPYSYLDAKCPDTVHPSLWRQAQLCLTNGLFEVTEGIYQVRGFDLSNMSIIEGDTGVIVIDPLVSAECAAAGLALYRGHRGDKPVTGVVYTHSHADHFGGVMGVLPNGAGTVPILAPEGFMEHAVSENVYAGPAMTRRANYMYVDLLDPSPTGQVSTGLGIRVSAGSVGLLPPTVDITRTGQEETIDGVRIVFQITPGTEAPAEMNFHFPDRRAPSSLRAPPAAGRGDPLRAGLRRRPGAGRQSEGLRRRWRSALCRGTDVKHAVFADHRPGRGQAACWPTCSRNSGDGAENATCAGSTSPAPSRLREGVRHPQRSTPASPAWLRRSPSRQLFERYLAIAA